MLHISFPHFRFLSYVSKLEATSVQHHKGIVNLLKYFLLITDVKWCRYDCCRVLILYFNQEVYEDKCYLNAGLTTCVLEVGIQTLRQKH